MTSLRSSSPFSISFVQDERISTALSRSTPRCEENEPYGLRAKSRCPVTRQAVAFLFLPRLPATLRTGSPTRARQRDESHTTSLVHIDDERADARLSVSLDRRLRWLTSNRSYSGDRSWISLPRDCLRQLLPGLAPHQTVGNDGCRCLTGYPHQGKGRIPLAPRQSREVNKLERYSNLL